MDGFPWAPLVAVCTRDCPAGILFDLGEAAAAADQVIPLEILGEKGSGHSACPSNSLDGKSLTDHFLQHV